MPQIRRMRRGRSSGDSTWPPQSHRTGSSSSQTAPPPAPSSVNWDDDLDNFMPPKPWPPRPDVPPPIHESRTIKERKGKSRGSSSQTAPREILVICSSDPKSGRASRVELPPSPLLSPSPLSGSRGQKMRAQREGAEFYIWGGSLPPPAARQGGGKLPPHI